jgi:DNA-binding transcriptional MerR regulator
MRKMRDEFGVLYSVEMYADLIEEIDEKKNEEKERREWCDEVRRRLREKKALREKAEADVKHMKEALKERKEAEAKHISWYELYVAGAEAIKTDDHETKLAEARRLAKLAEAKLAEAKHPEAKMAEADAEAKTAEARTAEAKTVAAVMNHRFPPVSCEVIITLPEAAAEPEGEIIEVSDSDDDLPPTVSPYMINGIMGCDYCCAGWFLQALAAKPRGPLCECMRCGRLL